MIETDPSQTARPWQGLSAIRLRLKRPLEVRLDGSQLLPERTRTLSNSEIAALPVQSDYGPYRVDDFFEVEGEYCDDMIVEGNCQLINRIGSEMRSGKLTICGDAGQDIARQMRGGHLEVLGNVGDRLASGLRGGTIIVHGDAGDSLGLPPPGRSRGIRDGDIVILGNAGHRVGQGMRRGTLMIVGNAGDNGASELIAGTIVVLGQIGERWGGGMRRGSILLAQPPTSPMGAELTTRREFELGFLPLIWRHLQAMTDPSRTFIPCRLRLPETRWAYRQVGDLAVQGRGEVLVLTRLSE